jgi:hypothetical protein
MSTAGRGDNAGGQSQCKDRGGVRFDGTHAVTLCSGGLETEGEDLVACEAAHCRLRGSLKGMPDTALLIKHWPTIVHQWVALQYPYPVSVDGCDIDVCDSVKFER